MTEEPTTPLEGIPSACPFVAFEDDRDHRSSSPDYRHRCFAAPEPEPRAFPHQERYCLSGDFAQCPVFLDWARQEAAAVKASGAPAVAIAGAAAADGAEASDAADDESTPAFLAGRPRTASSADTGPASRRTADVAASLWSYDSETKRPNAPAAPVPPSSLGEPAIAMARRGPSHPGWETPPRLENFPRLRSREERRANQPLLFAAIGMALVMVALVIFPIITSGKGGTAGGSGSAGPSTSGSGALQVSASPSSGPSAASGPTFFQYTVRTGDQMWAIARYFNIVLADLIAANPQIKDPGHLEVGWVLNVPPPGWHPAGSPGAASPS